MSSTIYYKGTLKECSTFEDLYEVVCRQSTDLHCKIVKEEDAFYLEFAEGQSEPLLFRLNNGKINWFCKWNNPGNPDEYYKIFDLFISIKPLFKSLRVDDDEGAWNEYLLNSKPCKIHLRELLGPAENALLERDFIFSKYDLSELMKPGMRFFPYSNAVYCVIAQDFMRVVKADSTKTLDKNHILELVNRLQIEEKGQFSLENFAFQFPYILLMIWVGYCLTYGRKGRVCQLSDEVRGLKINRLAAEFGILSIFLNIHSGTVNSKHAEMKRFAADYIYTGPKSNEYSARAKAELAKIIKDYIKKNNIDTTLTESLFIPVSGEFKAAYDSIIAGLYSSAPNTQAEEFRRSLEVLVSLLDYLGFRYVGPEEQESNNQE